MRVGWLSDIHLNFLSDEAGRAFVANLASEDADAWVITGDIGEADSVSRYLMLFEELLPCKTYFTLGNHDFFGGSFSKVLQQVGDLVRGSRRLVWLTAADPQVLDDQIAVVGDDAWGDGRHGDPHGTPVELSDFYRIEELTGLTRRSLVVAVNQLGEGAARRLGPKLERAASACRRVLVVTHVPPFREAAWHQGRPCDDTWVPWFSCRAVGDTILKCALSHPGVEFLVLCGHTHGSGEYSPVDNVFVRTAWAEYGAPRVQCLIDTDSWGRSA